MERQRLPHSSTDKTHSEESQTSRLSQIGKTSESPIGFIIMAVFGISLLAIVKAWPQTQDLPPPPQIENKTSQIENLNTQSDETADPNMQEGKHASPSDSEKKTEPGKEVWTVKKRETLTELLKRAGITNQIAHAASHSLSEIADLRKIKPGQKIWLQRDPTNNKALEFIEIRDQFDSIARTQASDSGFEAARRHIEVFTLSRYFEGEIEDSLYLSAKRAGMPEKIIIDFIHMMSFDIDFQRDIRKGNRFKVYFQRRYAPEFGDTEESDILFGEIALKNDTYDAILFEDQHGRDYFDSTGKSVRKALMKTPVDGARLSSTFGKRRHPVLGYTRLHKGLDFAANTGTPIMAAGDGTVERASRYGSFGNYVRIRHGDGYKTAYAHLSKFGRGIKKGKKVKQGQIIGYVGRTGRVTGPHLHYEVLKGDRQINPLKLKLPNYRELKAQTLQSFQKTTEIIKSEMELSKQVNTVLVDERHSASSR